MDHVTKDDLRDVRDQIIGELREGFRAMNGRVRDLEVASAGQRVKIAELDDGLDSVKQDMDRAHIHRRSSDTTFGGRTSDDRKPITRRDVTVFAAAIGGGITAVGLLAKFVLYLVKGGAP